MGFSDFFTWLFPSSPPREVYASPPRRCQWWLEKKNRCCSRNAVGQTADSKYVFCLQHGRMFSARKHKPAKPTRKQVLNALILDADATDDQIRARIRRLKAATHPDSGGTHEQFLFIKEAEKLLF